MVLNDQVPWLAPAHPIRPKQSDIEMFVRVRVVLFYLGLQRAFHKVNTNITNIYQLSTTLVLSWKGGFKMEHI